MLQRGHPLHPRHVPRPSGRHVDNPNAVGENDVETDDEEEVNFDDDDALLLPDGRFKQDHTHKPPPGMYSFIPYRHILSSS